MLSAIAELLLLAVPFNRLGMCSAVALPMIRITGPPFSRAIPADLAVFRIDGNLLPVILGAALALADRFAADRLVGLKLRRLKGLLAVAAAVFTHKPLSHPVPLRIGVGREQRKLADLFHPHIGSSANLHIASLLSGPHQADLETDVECIPHPRRCHHS